jgi:hypothetical protein
MPHPTWLAYGFAVVMVAVSVYCIGRLVAARPLGRRNHYDVNAAHVLMGFAMAGMLVPAWNVVPDGVFEVVFGAIALWFGALSVRFVALHGLGGTDDRHVHHISHYLIHMVMACAMLYMYWLGTPLSPHGTMAMSGPPPGAGDPGLTLFLITVLFASAVWQLDAVDRFSPSRLVVATAAGGGAPGTGAAGTGPAGADGPGDPAERWLAPRLEMACHIAMCLTMGYMLVLMV